LDRDERIIDLHTHSSLSDGALTPEELVEEAMYNGVSAIALTDHDEVSGIPRAVAHGGTKGIEVIPGIELTAYAGETEIHILGLLLETYSPDFEKKIGIIAESRRQRVYEIVEKLGARGVTLDPDEIFETAGEGVVGRPHVARVLLRHNLVTTIHDAFRTYIGNDAPCYAAKYRMTCKEAVDLVHSVGGMAFLAHPGLTRRDELIPDLLEYGMEGIEVYHMNHSPQDTKRYRALADERGALVTGGSDFHGNNFKEGEKIGRPAVRYETLARIKAAKVQRKVQQ